MHEHKAFACTDVIIMWYSMHIGHGNQTNERSFSAANVKNDDAIFSLLPRHPQYWVGRIIPQCKSAIPAIEYWVSYCTSNSFTSLQQIIFHKRIQFLWLLKIVLIYCETREIFFSTIVSTVSWTIIVMCGRMMGMAAMFRGYKRLWNIETWDSSGIPIVSKLVHFIFSFLASMTGHPNV